LIVLGLFGCLGLGCGGSSSTPVGRTRGADEQHIQAVAMLWSKYKTDMKKPPASADELKKFAKQMKPDQLEKMGVKDVDSAFISPRDKQPYVINTPKNNPMGLGTVVYEKTGVNGKHMTATNMGSVAEVDAADLATSVGKEP